MKSCWLVVSLLLVFQMEARAGDRDVLVQTAQQSLEANIITLDSGPYLAAGHFQFHTLWTRDFAWASRGLLLMKRADVVRNHLDHLLQNLRANDGLVPKTLDSMAPQKRVFLSTLDLIRFRVPFFRPIENAIEPYFTDENKSEAIDSNALVLLAALEYFRVTGDIAWWSTVEGQLVKVYRFYDSHLANDGLINQQAHSDWQDSVEREGKTFYTNLLYYIVSQRLAEFPSFAIRAEQVQKLGKTIQSTFFDPSIGVYRALERGPYISLDGNLLALDLNFVTDGDARWQLYSNLKKHPVFDRGAGLPGGNTYPDYPKKWLSLAPRMSGLDHYHDRLYWSWLMGLAGKTAVLMGDTATSQKLSAALVRVAQRDGSICEIYRDRPALEPWQSLVYQSERPFSWGAAFVLDFAQQL